MWEPALQLAAFLDYCADARRKDVCRQPEGGVVGLRLHCQMAGNPRAGCRAVAQCDEPQGDAPQGDALTSDAMHTRWIPISRGTLHRGPFIYCPGRCTPERTASKRTTLGRVASGHRQRAMHRPRFIERCEVRRAQGKGENRKSN